MPSWKDKFISTMATIKFLRSIVFKYVTYMIEYWRLGKNKHEHPEYNLILRINNINQLYYET